MQVKRFFAADMRQAMSWSVMSWAPMPPSSVTAALPAVSN